MFWNLVNPGYGPIALNEGVGGISTLGADLALWFDTNQAYKSSGGGIVTPASILTVVRASAGSYYDSAGVLRQAADNTLRLDYSPTTGAALGVLVEEQRTNLLTYSEQFDNAAWVKSESSVTSGDAIAPDGTLTADKVTETAATSQHTVTQSQSVVNGTTYTYSVYLKAAELGYALLGTSGSGLPFTVISVDLSTGAVSTGTGTPLNAFAVDVGNGWWRAGFSIASTFSASANLLVYLSQDGIYANRSHTGTLGAGIYLWGAQLEAGAFATSYIPTVASQVTRAADQISILTSAFPYSATEGTVVFEGGVQGANAVDNRLAMISNASASERSIDINLTISTLRIASTTVVATVSTGNCAPTNTNTVGQPMKVAGAYKQDDFAACLDGGAVATDTSGAVPAPGAATDLYIGRFSTGIRYLNGHIKRLAYYASRKDNSTLQVLST